MGKVGGDDMAGRPRRTVATSTGKIGKAERLRRQNEEEKIKVGRDGLEAPEWLDEEAKEEFVRIVEEAGAIKLFDNLDLSVLAIYCNAYSCYRQLTEKIQEKGFGYNGASDSDISKQEKYVKQILQCSSKLGLATTDRLKLIVPVPEDNKKNKFLKYLS
jgi:P27 family predicted phage terminase small subunit